MSSPPKSTPPKSSFYATFKSRSSSSAKTAGPGRVPSSSSKNKVQGLLGVTAAKSTNSRRLRTKRKPSKVQRMMSANPEDISKNLLASGDLQLAPLEYSVFWNSVSAPRFIARCIKFLMDYENDPEKVAKGLKKTPEDMYTFVTSILHTITLFDLFSPPSSPSQSNIALSRGFEVFGKHKKNKPMAHDKRIYEVLSRIDKHQKTGVFPVVSIVVECAR